MFFFFFFKDWESMPTTLASIALIATKQWQEAARGSITIDDNGLISMIAQTGKFFFSIFSIFFV